MAEYYYDKGIRKKVKEGYTISSKGTIVKASKKKKKKEEDIAPVKKTTGGNKNSWFKSGGFSDGVDGVGDFFGDLIETTVGTVGDAVVGVGKGVTRLGEGIVDLGAYGAAGVADAIGKDKWADKTRKKAQKDWTSNAWKSAEEKFDKNSILGNKADAVTEGIGQVGGIILTGGIAGALGAGGAAATAITTGVTGLSGMGSGMSEAYRNKATDKEAFTYGAIAGTAEAATELLFGGLGKTVKAIGLSKGLSSADDMLAKKITSKFTNQIAKNFTEFGIKAGAEGTEEVLSGIAQAVGKKVTYMEEKELEELIKDENLLDQFIVGSITSGIAQSGYVPGMTQGSLREANKTGTDFISGLTQNEQKVVDKEYENRIAEAEESGDKLSKKEKNKIYDEVVDDLEKGRISIDTIESAIGGKTYETYKNMDEQEKAVRKQIEELENTPFSQITVKQQEKLTELRKQLDTMEKSGLKNKVKAQLSNEVSELALSSKLSESYNERTRKTQSFDADLTKYDAKQQDTVKKAIDSKILNNSNRTHEFVDMVAKISADKGVSFDFTNNKKLKESGLAVEGKTVNGYVKDGNIAVNIDSNKSLNSVVGHEITHTLEGTEHYNELQNAVKEYATTKGDYETRFNELSELYKGVEGSNIESELTADLVGDYLFTDKDFINNLSTKKPNIFQKIYNEIKYLCKIATAGSKEARQLEKVKRAFDKAYKEAKASTDTNTDTKHSLSENKNIKKVEQYADTEEESIFRTGWYKSNQKTVDEIVKNRPQTETENFKSWFKESKAVNKDNEPLLLYHGTETRFTEFESDGKPMWVSSNPMYAHNYTKPTNKLDDVVPSGKVFGKSNERIMPVYIQAENPADFGSTDISFEEALTDISNKLNIPTNELKEVWEQVGKPEQLFKVVHSAEMVDLLKEHGYDSIKAIEGGSPTWAVFESNQIKSAVANKGTFDSNKSDIRFSLSKTVERTKDLVALHNLNADKLTSILELGGFPMPSIAITKDTASHEGYGDISVILKPNAINPESNSDNKVYSADAYTPTFPATAYKLNDAELRKLAEKLDTSISMLEANEFRNGNLSDILNNFAENKAAKELFVKEKGYTVEPVLKPRKLNDKYLERVQEFVLSDDFSFDKLVNDLSYREQYFDKIKENTPGYGESSFITRGINKYIDTTNEKFDILSNNKELAEKIKKEYLLDIEQLKGKETLVEDSNSYTDGLNNLINEKNDEFNTFVKELIEPVLSSKYLRNNKDYYTASGNPRDFDSLHEEYNAENAVKIMRENSDTNAVNSMIGVSLGELKAVLSKQYNTIDEIHQDKAKISEGFDEEIQAKHEECRAKFFDITKQVADSSPIDNRLIAHNNASQIILEALGKSKEAKGIYNYINKNYTNQITMELAEEIENLAKDIMELPTRYFEAKPQRVVGFDEVGAVVIPYNADAKLKQELLNKGLSIAEYNPEVEGDRKKVVNQFEDYKFSLSNREQITAPYGNYNVYGKDVALQQNTAPINTQNVVEDIAPLTEEQANVRDAEQSLDTMPSDEFEKLVQSYMDDAPGFLFDDEEVRAWAEQQARENPQGVTQKENTVTPESPLDADRDIYTIGKERKRNAYMYENPEVKPFFQDEARTMLWELQNSTRGKKERMDIDAPSEEGWYGTHRHTSDEIAYLLDTFKYKYNDITKGLMAIIDDHGAENNAVSKRIEFLLDDRLRLGYTVFTSGQKMPPNEHYIELLNKKQVTEYNEEARSKYFQPEVETVQDIAPVKEIAAEPVTTTNENVQPQVNEKQVTSKLGNGAKQRKWVKTSTESKPVDRKILPKDLEQKAITYEPIPNKVTLNSANEMLKRNGYDESVKYFNSQFQNKKVSLDDIALGERLIQEAVKKGDMVTAGELIQNVSILGTELGQKVQALSIIQRLTPEGQLKTLTKIVERGKTKGDKVFEGVEITQEMIDKVLKTYRKDGTYSQEELDRAVEEVKQQIADQMKVTKMDKINSWRYLSMLGNPKTHVRNIISNVGMKGTMAVKDAIARTIETVAPVKTRTKTWKKVSDDVKEFAKQTTKEMQSILEDGGKYSDTNDIKSKRQIFKNKVLNAVFEFNNDMLSKEDWWFQSAAFNKAFSEYLTANGINTKEDIQNNAELIEKAKAYATEQSEIATFKQYSYIAHKLNEIESKNTATQIGVGAVVPFKKTPVNIAKTGLNYSPLGFMKTLTYDASQVKKGNMEASQMIDHLAQNMTGTGLALAGYMLAMSGFLNGAGEEDKEGKFDYQLGKQSYSVNIGGNTYSLSWLTPMAMPLFVGANAFEILTEGKEWDGNVVIESLTQTLDPMSEMSVLSGLTNVLSSYKSGSGIWADIAQTTGQNYVTQFVPTLSSQVATLMDDKQRSTKVAGNSDFKYLEETVNKLKSKIPGLRETLEPSTDIWGREVKLNENKWQKVFDTFLAPYSRKENIATQIDEELKDLYSDTGDGGLFPQTPKNSVNYEGEKYNMSAKEYTSFKKTYGQNALELMEELFQTTTYQNATASDKAEMVDKVYDYANDEAKRKYLAKQDVEFTNAKKDGEAYYKENIIKGAIENDMPLMEFDFYNEYPEKYNFLQKNNVSYEEYSKDEDTREAYNWAFNNPEKYTLSKAISKDVVAYRGITKGLYEIRADKDSNGKTIIGAKEKKINYINSLDIDKGEKLVLFKSEYNADDTYNYEIIDYLNSREDISYEETETILKQLGFTVTADGNIYWD